MKQHLSNQETEELGESYIARYYKLSPSDSLCVDIEGFATECLGLDIRYRTFANEDSDTIGFLADGVTPVCVYERWSSTNSFSRQLKAEENASPSLMKRRIIFLKECVPFHPRNTTGNMIPKDHTAATGSKNF